MKKTKIGISLFIILICLVLGGLMAIPVSIITPMVAHHMEVKTYKMEAYGVKSEPLILNTEDGLSLRGWLVPVKAPKATVILLSGIQNPSVTAFWSYAKLLQENGYEPLLVEMRAHGVSEGKQVALGMTEWLDVKAAVEYIKTDDSLKELPIVVWGTSMGAATAINAAGELSDIDGVISCSAFSSWEDVFSDQMLRQGAPEVLVNLEKPFVKLYLTLLYGKDWLQYTPIQEIQKLGNRPILLMHSTKDSEVPYESFERLCEKVNAEVFVREGDYHFICLYEDDPGKDTEFSEAILNFLNHNFTKP